MTTETHRVELLIKAPITQSDKFWKSQLSEGSKSTSRVVPNL